MFSTRKYSSFKYLLSGVCMCFAVTTANAITILTVNQPDNVIGLQVQSYTSSSTITGNVQQDNAVQFIANNATPEVWTAEFSAPLNKQLEVTHYEDASLPKSNPNSSLSPTKPGINISIGGRQCTKVSGRFDVLEVSYDAQGLLLSLAVDFVQICGNNNTTLLGSIRHNTPSLALITTTPIAIAGADQHVVEDNIVDLNLVPIEFKGNLVKLNAGNSSPGDGANITSYFWKQLSGTTITLSNATSATPSFVLQNIKLGGDELVLELTVTNSNGIVDTDQITIFVASKSDPQTSFFFESDPKDIIGKGNSLFVDVDDAIFTVENTDQYHAHINIDNGLNWFTNFGAVSSSNGLLPGSYEPVKRHPVALAADPGLYIHDSVGKCVNLTGNFKINQIKRNTTNILNNLYIEFLQECDQLNTINPPALRGYIKFNYIDTSVPVANAGTSTTVTEATLVTLDASKSSDVDGSIDAYKWKQVSGAPVTLSDNLISNPSFIAPDFAISSNEDLVFQVLVTDNLNFKARSTVNIKIIAKVTEPPVRASSLDGSGIGGGGGGCSLNQTSTVDFTFYLMLLIAFLIQFNRKQKTINRN
ncbi:MAG: hypothetical protein ACC653_06520 [Gammaproteobacteria bacterium]